MVLIRLMLSTDIPRIAAVSMSSLARFGVFDKPDEPPPFVGRRLADQPGSNWALGFDYPAAFPAIEKERADAPPTARFWPIDFQMCRLQMTVLTEVRVRIRNE
jgi:hypothetical protein